MLAEIPLLSWIGSLLSVLWGWLQVAARFAWAAILSGISSIGALFAASIVKDAAARILLVAALFTALNVVIGELAELVLDYLPEMASSLVVVPPWVSYAAKYYFAWDTFVDNVSAVMGAYIGSLVALTSLAFVVAAIREFFRSHK